MKLSECTIGTLVIERPISMGSPSLRRIGHVVGLEENNVGEIIPTIQFARPWLRRTPSSVGYHHNNLDRYTG